MKSDFVEIEEADLISSELCEDFIVRSTISLNIRVAILYYEPKDNRHVSTCRLFLYLSDSKDGS